MRSFIRKIVRGWRKNKLEGNISFAQCGEDIIIDFIFKGLNIRRPLYLDIGAYHPISLSNTYFFYLKGSRGVCIEPDPFLFERFRKIRKEDICLNVGIRDTNIDKADFYIMSSKTLNTFSKEDAKRYQDYGKHKIEKVIQIPCVSINDILRDYFPVSPDLISIDIEGKEFDLLTSFEFSQYRPAVICIETLTYTDDKSEHKLYEIIDFMVGKDYFMFADTYINSIFVDRQTWEQR